MQIQFVCILNTSLDIINFMSTQLIFSTHMNRVQRAHVLCQYIFITEKAINLMDLDNEIEINSNNIEHIMCLHSIMRCF